MDSDDNFRNVLQAQKEKQEAGFSVVAHHYVLPVVHAKRAVVLIARPHRAGPGKIQ